MSYICEVKMKLKPLLEFMLSEAGLDTGNRTLGGSHLDRDQTLFSHENHEEIIQKLKSQIDAPVVSVKYSTLGGERDSSILLSVSITPKDEWPNGIFENSNYSKFHIQQDGVVEQFSKNYKIGLKFRKTRVKSVDDLIKKINEYLNKIKK